MGHKNGWGMNLKIGCSQAPPVKCMDIASYNFPAYHFGVNANGWDGFIITTAYKFKFVNALDGDATHISIESCSQPGHYLRHQGFDVKVMAFENSELYKDDASWKMIPGLIGDDTKAFESANYPSRLIRHQGFDLKLHPKANDDLYKKDASFQLTNIIFGPP